MARHEQAEPFDKLKGRARVEWLAMSKLNLSTSSKAGARQMARHEQAEPFDKLKAGRASNGSP
jgi:hypothetical protein